jgi:hypothetical protein
MSKTTIVILSIIFVILIVGASYPYWRKSIIKEPTNTTVSSIYLGDYNDGNTDKIGIKKGTDEKIFTKNDSKWTLGKDEVKPDKIKEFFDDLKNTQMGSVISRNKDNQQDMGIDDANGYILSLTKSGETKSYILGNFGTASSSFYLRRSGSDDVYDAYGNLRGIVAQDASAWKPEPVKVDTTKTSDKKVEVKKK